MPVINTSGLKRVRGPQPWVGSKYVTAATMDAVIDNVAPQWLLRVNNDIINTAKKFQPRFRSKERVFLGITHGRYSVISCSGPGVAWDAFENEDRIPASGYKYGDINPTTGEKFPGGYNKHGSYITMDDKLAAHGEARPPSVSRVYTPNVGGYQQKYGNILRSSGFLERATKLHLGSTDFATAKYNYDVLAMRLGMQFSQVITDQIAFEAMSRGFIAHIGPLYVLMGI